MARPLAVGAALCALVVVSGAGGSPGQTPRPGGTLVIGMSQEPVCLNVAVPACWAAGSSVLTALSLVLPGFAEVGPDLALRPVLVSSASATRGPRFSATYRIDPRARWSDGRPITTGDVAFTLQAVRRSLNPPREDPIWTIERVVPLDSKTFRIEASRPYVHWRLGLMAVLPRHVLKLDVAAVWKEAIDDPRTGNRSEAGPSSSRAGIAARGWCSFGTRASGGSGRSSIAS